MNNTDSTALLCDSFSAWTQCLAVGSCKHSEGQGHMEFGMTLKSQGVGCKLKRTNMKTDVQKSCVQEEKMVCKVVKDL